MKELVGKNIFILVFKSRMISWSRITPQLRVLSVTVPDSVYPFHSPLRNTNAVTGNTIAMVSNSYRQTVESIVAVHNPTPSQDFTGDMSDIPTITWLLYPRINWLQPDTSMHTVAQH